MQLVNKNSYLDLNRHIQVFFIKHFLFSIKRPYKVNVIKLVTAEADGVSMLISTPILIE